MASAVYIHFRNEAERQLRRVRRQLVATLAVTDDARSEQLRDIRAALAEFESQRPAQLMVQWGRWVLQEAHENFEIKSRGGTGSDFITWAPLKPSTIRRNRGRTAIGVATGELGDPRHDRLEVIHRQNKSIGVLAGFGAPHAEFFDERRPLMPDEPPDDWIAHLQEMAEVWGETILDRLD